ncbi:uncharacterized protein RHO17_026264 isoform 2-T2 [Thomomys bottae]
MQCSFLSQDTWRQGAKATCTTSEKIPYSQEFLLRLRESIADYLHDNLSHGDRRPRPLGYSSSNSTALSTSQQLTLPIPRQIGNIASGVQMMEDQEEIDPGDIKYRLPSLTEAPLEIHTTKSYGWYLKPPLPIFSTTHRPHFQPLKTEPGPYYGEKPSHSEDQSMTVTSQGSFQSRHLSGLSVFPDNPQGRRLASKEHLGHLEYANQHQRDFRDPVWSQGLSALGPDNQHARQVQKATALGCSATRMYQEISRPKRETAILDREPMVKFDGDTVHKMSTLPPLRPSIKKEKGKFPPHTYELFKARIQVKTTSKQFFQDRVAQRPKCPRPPRPPFRNRKPLVSFQDRTTPSTTYMPLFSERVKLCKPKSK